MEIVIPKAEDFNFTTSTLFSYTSAPSSPRPFGNPLDYCNYYASAPNSPRRSAATVDKDLLFDLNDRKLNYVVDSNATDVFDFAIGFSGQLDSNGCPNTLLASADELFEHGKIRPLRPQNSHEGASNNGSSREHRGRDVRRAARSLSPMRSKPNPEFDIVKGSPDPMNTLNSPSSGDYSFATKKWRLKDLFLFRSASEGRATGRGSKDPLLKYTPLSSSSSSSVFIRPFLSKKKASQEQDCKEVQESTPTSSKSNEKDSGSSVLTKKGSGRRASVHEMHYAAGRAAVIDEMKKKTPLAYHHNSMFSCLRLNPAASHHHSMMSRVPSRSSFSRN